MVSIGKILVGDRFKFYMVYAVFLLFRFPGDQLAGASPMVSNGMSLVTAQHFPYGHFSRFTAHDAVFFSFLGGSETNTESVRV